VTRAPVDTIAAPPFPAHLPWVNARAPQASIQHGRLMLVEFWDFCRPNSLRTLPYVRAWHERYGPRGAAGLLVVGVHCPGFQPSRDPDAVRAAVARLGISHPVLIDGELELWREYGNAGWPARYLFDGRARLFHYHYGEGAYEETELAIQELVGVAREPLAPLRPEDAPGARLQRQSEDRPGAYCGPYEAGGVWAVLEGAGRVRARHLPAAEPGAQPSPAAGAGASPPLERELAVSDPGAYALLEHPRHAAGLLQLDVAPGVVCHATCFTPGVT
jgi:hypothetical protein